MTRPRGRRPISENRDHAVRLVLGANLPASQVVNDERYQLKDFSRENLHVLARLDSGKLDLKAPLVRRKDADSRELWDTPWLQKMYFEALKWSMAR